MPPPFDPETQCPPDDWRGTPDLSTGSISLPDCPSGSGSGSGGDPGLCVSYKDVCENEMLRRYKCNPDTGEWTFDRDLNVPCVTEEDLSTYPPKTLLDHITNVCTRKAKCVRTAVDLQLGAADPDVFLVEADATAGVVFVYLPDWEEGLYYLVIKTDASANKVFVGGVGATVNGAVDFELKNQWQGATFYSACQANTWVSPLSYVPPGDGILSGNYP